MDPYKLSEWLARGKTQLSFKNGGQAMTAEVPRFQFWVSVKDVLVTEAYEAVKGFELSNSFQTIVDAGAFVGLYSMKAAVHAKKVLSLEPNPRSYAVLEKNLAGVMNSEAWNVALSDREGESFLTDESTSSRLDASGPIRTRTISLATLLKKTGEIDLMKMDIEGAEFQVLLSASDDELKMIRRIVGEFHSDDLDGVLRRLKDSGFVVRILGNRSFRSVWKPWRCSLDGFFFVKLLISSAHLVHWLTFGLLIRNQRANQMVYAWRASQKT